MEVRKLADLKPGEAPQFAAMIGGHVEGAIPNGSRIRKVKSEDGDATPNGSLGTVLSSVKNEKVSPHTAYFVEWDHRLGIPVGVMDWKIEEAP